MSSIATTKLSSKDQVVIPEEIRERLGLKPGTKFVVLGDRAGGRPATATQTFSAFSDMEVDAIHAWVSEGGGLLLLTDHMPFAGAAAHLAKRFGFTFLDGFVEDSETGDPVVFHRSDGTLLDHPITRGLGQDADIDFVTTFVGQAFRAEHAEPLMLLGPRVVSYQPEIPWDYDEDSPRLSVAGWLQGAK